MKQLCLSVLILLFASSCALFQTHKMDIEQGNIISESAVDRLHPGMSEATVRGVMGTPVLVNVFTPDRIEYIYTFQRGYGKMQKRYVSLLFSKNRLQAIRSN